MINSLIILAVVILPGWLSLSVNQRYYPRIVDRSTVMAWGILLYHAMIVHLIGIAFSALLVMIGQGYFLDTLGLDRILVDGPVDFARESPGTSFAIFGLYASWMLVGSTISAIMNLPSRAIYGLGRVASFLKLAPSPVTQDEPVWFRALNVDRRQADKLNVQVYVRMKNGDIYAGNLESYPILSDAEESKDIRLGDSVLYPGGDSSYPVELDFSNYGGGGVLLNTVNISSIEYLFHDDYD